MCRANKTTLISTTVVRLLNSNASIIPPVRNMCKSKIEKVITEPNTVGLLYDT